jgi:uncharacterized membrane protein YcaP (DUF421 family)
LIVTQSVTDLLAVFAQTLIIYVVIIGYMSLFGRRQFAQITYIELLVITLLGSAVETAMVAGNTSLLAGLVSASTLLVANRVFSILVSRWKWLRQRVIGGPLILIREGVFVDRNLRRAGLTQADVEGAIRQRGFADPADVRYAVYEVDGSIGVVPIDAPVHRLARL